MEYILYQRTSSRLRAANQRRKTVALHRSLRDVTDPFVDPNFSKLYRLTPAVALALIADLKPYFPGTSNCNAIPVELHVLAALHFYAQGSYQKPDGRDACISLSQASVSKAIILTTAALNVPPILNKWIKFPNNETETQNIIQKNYRKYHMPGVLGYVDGTHILIKKPVEHEELYVNRKSQHSLNVQVVCDCDLIILNVLARYPGSSHDAYVWRASSVRDRMSTFENCWVLGDSGYPLEPWLMTPVLNAAASSPEDRYTQQHIRARNCVERCFGVLKNRFRCLHKNRVLEYSPTKVGCIVNACAVLHNMCTMSRLEEPELEVDSVDSHSSEEDLSLVHDSASSHLHIRGIAIREHLINRLP